jgi:hypothetical protein
VGQVAALVVITRVEPGARLVDPMAEGGAQCATSLGHASAADGPGGLVEAPGGLGGIFGGQEVQLSFHTSILPRGYDKETERAVPGKWADRP